MRTLALLALMVGVLTAQEPAPRPWSEGRVEKYCHQTQADVDRMRREFPDKADRILLCACKHTCDPDYEHAGETDRRRWDSACLAACNPGNCNCSHPCDS